MLQRPELNTREHIVLWLDGKEGSFFWSDAQNCACGQYVTEFKLAKDKWPGPLGELNTIGGRLCRLYERGYVPFAALAAQARKEWGLG